jgi:uncharacterized membrane protein (UPF0127 family)
MQTIVLSNSTKATQIGDKIEVADSSVTRFVGLMGRKGLGPGEGMWIKPSSGVHTMWMRFTIDVVALDKNRKVCALWPQLRPWRISPVSLKVASVVELAPGAIQQLGIEVGDQLDVAA